MNDLNDTDGRHKENEELRAFILRISLGKFGVEEALEPTRLR